MLLLSACHRDVTTNNNKINRKSNENTLSPVTIQFVIQFHSPTTANLKKNKSFRTYCILSQWSHPRAKTGGTDHDPPEPTLLAMASPSCPQTGVLPWYETSRVESVNKALRQVWKEHASTLDVWAKLLVCCCIA